jgi:hypothetical protein
MKGQEENKKGLGVKRYKRAGMKWKQSSKAGFWGYRCSGRKQKEE